MIELGMNKPIVLLQATPARAFVLAAGATLHNEN
jgi:hypothetical protein